MTAAFHRLDSRADGELSIIYLRSLVLCQEERSRRVNYIVASRIRETEALDGEIRWFRA